MAEAELLDPLAEARRWRMQADLGLARGRALREPTRSPAAQWVGGFGEYLASGADKPLKEPEPRRDAPELPRFYNRQIMKQLRKRPEQEEASKESQIGELFFGKAGEALQDYSFGDSPIRTRPMPGESILDPRAIEIAGLLPIPITRGGKAATDVAKRAKQRPLSSGQLELPKFETTPAQRLEQATSDLARLEEKGPMHIGSARQTPRLIEFFPETAPNQDYYGVLRTATETERPRHEAVPPGIQGGRSLGGGEPLRRDILSGLPTESELGVEARYGLAADVDRARARIAALRGAREDVQAAAAEEARQRRRELTEEFVRTGTTPPTDPVELADWARQRARIARSKPIVSQYGRVFEPDPETSGYLERGARRSGMSVADVDPTTYAQQSLVANAIRESVEAQRGARDIVQFIESDPRRAAQQPFYEPTVPQWAQRLTAPSMTGELPAGQAWWNQKLGVRDYEQQPNLMNREAVAAFLEAAQENPNLFMYGTAPPANVRSLEQMARHFGQKGGQPISVEYTGGGGSDEPYKIEKRHGRGEAMYDEYGDIKYQTYEPGAKMYEPDTGELKVKTQEKELTGPPMKGEEALYGEVEVPKRAAGGEMKYDESGEPVYQLSRGGEPVRDERGRIQEVKNPDYYGDDELEQIELSLPGGARMQIDPSGGEHYWTATGVGKGKGGDVLYQTALANAVREGIDVGSGGLSGDNQLRLLSNVLSNYARMGENPRSVTGTLAGRAERVRGRAEGPEVWRAEAEEAKERMRDWGVKPERVQFTGDRFEVDGKEVAPDDLLAAVGWRGGQKNIGQKTVMRMAFFDWLRGAEPEEAAEMARKWDKLGPIFAGIAGAAVALPEASEDLD
jgi:hypothetical protein